MILWSRAAYRSRGIGNAYLLLRWMIPPMVVYPEKIDFRRFI